MPRRTAQQAAIDILLAWQKTGEPVDQVLTEYLRRHPRQDPRDSRLIMTMVYGVLRWQGFLDSVVKTFSKHPLEKMKPRTLTALRLGIYQLCFLDRVPESAAINETVQALKAARQPGWLTGFVNGLLRTVARRKNLLPDPRRDETIFLNYPAWLVERWRRRSGGQKAMELCRAANEEPPLVLRVNTRRIAVAEFGALLSQKGICHEHGAFAPEALLLPEYKGAVESLPGYGQGYFQVQAEAAQLVAFLLGPLQPAPYLDACAGLGGKTSHLAQMLPQGGSITAVEPSLTRLKLLRENLERLHLGHDVAIRPGKLEEFSPAGKKFHGILLDAPCSGLGVIRRHPDIRWNRAEADLLRSQQKQLLLLDAAATLLAPGGCLVYATCSTEPEENEAAVAHFLENQADFRIENAKRFLPAQANELVDNQGFFRTLPDAGGLDGFFAARLVKSEK